MLDKSIRDAVKRFCGKLSNPTAIMDDAFMCVYSNRPKLIPCDQTMLGIFQKSFSLSQEKVCSNTAMIGGCVYSVRIIPFEGYYICEFFEDSAILDLAQNSDIYEKILPIINELDYDVSAMWRGNAVLRSKLESDGGYDEQIGTADIEKYLIRLNSVINNISEYANIMFNSSEGVPLDINTMLAGLIGRCNTILSETGRYVDYVSEPGAIYIKSQARYVMSAVVNAIQNALLYSPRDCVPYVTLCREDPKSERGNVLLQIFNDSAMYIDRGPGGEEDKDLVFQRPGFGIPIIKRFAEMAGGSFSLTEVNGRVRVVISLPIVASSYDRQGLGVLGSSHYVYYKTEIPDILDLKMREVNMMFGGELLFS